MIEYDRQAHEIVAAYLAGRRVPEGMQALIERAVAGRLAAGREPALDAMLCSDLDAFAEAYAGRVGEMLPSDKPGDDDDSGPSTSTEVHWSTLGP
jgi:hypothetical protein